MRRFLVAPSPRTLGLLGLVCILAGPALAQERGEEVVGVISKLNGLHLTVTRENGPEVQVDVTPTTEVYFRDSGDRKLFPDPKVGDLRTGMGVRFVYGTGTLEKITVHYVPTGHQATPPPAPSASPAAAEWRSGVITRVIPRIGSVTIRSDGREQTYNVESRDALNGLRPGDAVRFTLASGGANRGRISAIQRER